MLAALIDGMNAGGANGAGAAGGQTRVPAMAESGNRNGSNLSTVLGVMELCWGDVGLLLSMPRQGLGNSAIASVATEEQLERYERPLGRDGDHRARGRLGLRGDPHDRRPRRRRVRAQRREDLRHLRRARRPGRGVGDARPLEGPRGDQVVRRGAREPWAEARAPRAQARDPRLGHRGVSPGGLPRPAGGHARQPRDQRQAGLRRGDADLRQHPASGRGDGGRFDPRMPGGDARASGARPA